jgi:hypothetical protein
LISPDIANKRHGAYDAIAVHHGGPHIEAEAAVLEKLVQVQLRLQCRVCRQNIAGAASSVSVVSAQSDSQYDKEARHVQTYSNTGSFPPARLGK